MAGIEFTGVIGDRQIAVTVSRPYGAGETWYVVADGFLVAQMVRRDGWRAYLPHGSWIQAEEIVMLGEMLDQAL